LAAVRAELNSLGFPLTGEIISHYRVLEGLGGGGMGLVYRAEDLRLGRQVALKFLPEESAANPASLGRFEREARSASALEHPNICPIYEFGEYEGQPFLAMQLLEGRTLREHISAAESGTPPFGLAGLLDVAIQIVDGLDAAHRHGIIHRDIKPANIFITKNSHAKILDFGLAKLARDEAFEGDQAERITSTGKVENKSWKSPLVATPDRFLSQTGVAMGTAGYMSPEQVRGEKLDARTDIFSFGLVLFEMATGKRAFRGDSGQILQEAILNQSPGPVRQGNSRLPERLDKIVGRALEKDRDARYQTASELRADLEALRHATSPIHRTLRRRIAAVAGALLVLVIVANFVFRSPPTPRMTRIIQLSEGGKMEPWANPVADELNVYFVEREGSRWTAMQSPVGGGPARQLFPSVSNARVLDVSSDQSQFLVGRFIRKDEMTIWIVPVKGGAWKRVGELAARYAIWTPDGKQIFYAQGSDLMACDNQGQHARKILTITGSMDRLAWSPDGKVLRFYGRNDQLESGSIWEVNSDGSNLHPVFPNFAVTRSSGNCCGHWTPDGKYFLFEAWTDYRANVWAVRERRGLLSWKKPVPVKLTSGPGFFTDPIPSKDGKKAFVYQINPQSLVWRFDPSGQSMRPLPDTINRIPFGDPLRKWTLHLDGFDGTLWRSLSDGNQLMQITHQPLLISDLQWSPDGGRILFSSTDAITGIGRIFFASRDTLEMKLLNQPPGFNGKAGWCPDSSSVIFTNVPGGSRSSSLYILDIATQRWQKLPGSDGLDQGVCSPNNRFILGLTQDFQKLKIYDLLSRRWRELINGSVISQPRWVPDSQSFYYQDTLDENEPVYRYWMKSGKRNTVIDFSEFYKQGYLHGRFYSLEPDGSLLLKIYRSDADLFALDLDLP
jgi:serine/threonine protein kinase/Tol biopolymer transport system component